MRAIAEEIEISFAEIRNDLDQLRVQRVRNAYFYEGTLKKADVVSIFRLWQQESEYICLLEFKNYEMDLLGETTYCSIEYHFVKAAKRGNDVYLAGLNRRFQPLLDLPPITIFDPSWGDKHTNALFLTLTFDPGLMSADDAWSNIGNMWHVFLAKLRQEYGPTAHLRCWESTENYYPHIHAMILFRKTVFDAFPLEGKDGKQRFRISRKHRDKIASFWHSFIDVQAIENTDGALKEIIKYIIKENWTSKGDKTNAMVWLHRKQQYSVTNSFLSMLKTNMTKMDLQEPQPDDLITQAMRNCNNRYTYIGIFRGIDLKVTPDIWHFSSTKPPPHIVDLIKMEMARQEINRFRN